MVIKVINLDKCIAKFGDIALLDLSQVMKRSGLRVERSARDKAPVDTGMLRDSVSTKPLNGDWKSGAVVFTPVEYAMYQEFGTVKMRAQPFMRPAFDENKTRIEQDVAKFIQDSLRIIAGK